MEEATKVCSRKDCPHGGVPQPLTNFYRDRGGRDGHRPDCKTCSIARVKRWYAQNRERRLAHMREYDRRRYAENSEAERQRIKRVRMRRDTAEGVQRNTVYVRAYRARKRAERGAA